MKMLTSHERMIDRGEDPTLTDKVDANSQEDYESGDCYIHGLLYPLDTVDKNIIHSPFPDGLMANTFQNGVVASKLIPAGTRFGPYEGKKIRAENTDSSIDTSHMWKIKVGGKLVYYIDGNGKNGNWMRYIKYASNESEENLVAFQLNGQIYYRSYKDIDIGEELFVGKDEDKAPGEVVSNDGEKAPIKHSGNDRDVACGKVTYDVKGLMELATSNNDDKTHEDKSINHSIDDESFICDFCGSGFTTSTLLTKHLSTHAGEKPYKCHLCTKSFNQRGNLKTHLRTHTGEKPFKCDLCVNVFTQKGNLQTHLRTHTGEKPFKCSICDRDFNQNGVLKTHLLTHTGERPFKCDLCGKGFTINGNLEKHLRTHTGEKPYKCDFCGKGCSTSGALKVHIRTHTGERPYKCDFCRKGFIIIGSLKKHLRTHTREKPV